MLTRAFVRKRRGVWIGAALTLIFGSTGCSPESLPSEQSAAEILKTLAPLPHYDPDRHHLWNRLHAALNTWVVVGQPERRFSSDWLGCPAEDRFLTGEYQAAAITLLGEFLAAEGTAGISDPLKRALMQHDLWIVFDWAERTGRSKLARRLAAVMKRVALSREDIGRLPDNFSLAVKGGGFQPRFDPAHPDNPFLPADLLDPQGPWIAIGNRGGETSIPVAFLHVKFFEGRDSFVELIQLPGGRPEGLNYLRDLATAKAPGEMRVPAFKKGTQVALLRRMMLLDDRGEIVCSPLTETLQVRVYGYGAGNGGLVGVDQRFVEVGLRRDQLLSDTRGGLFVFGPSNLESGYFAYLGTVRVENPRYALSQLRPKDTCYSCHMAFGGNGASLEAFSRVSFSDLPKADPVALDRESEERRTSAWKAGTRSFQTLQSFWRTDK
jgi:hypothetical protein